MFYQLDVKGRRLLYLYLLVLILVPVPVPDADRMKDRNVS